VTSALRRWRDALTARSIPPHILDSAPESPFGFPAELFRRRADASTRADPTPTSLRGVESLPSGGSVLDVGCGGGATSLPLAGRAGVVTGVDGQQDMLDSFHEAWAERGVDADTILGAWPDAADLAPSADLVLCGHVFYNVPQLEPFVPALNDHARRRVVVELTARHPLAWMSDLWQTFHGVDLPEGPTADDAENALRALGYAVDREDRAAAEGRAGGGFARRGDAIAIVRRRLCLPADRDTEIAGALGERLAEHDGLWSVGRSERVVTLWWDTKRAEL
jgi:SAM-dependent methyltransferase